jgi:hypothetical protein
MAAPVVIAAFIEPHDPLLMAPENELMATS